jgi:hypothetical protein
MICLGRHLGHLGTERSCLRRFITGNRLDRIWRVDGWPRIKMSRDQRKSGVRRSQLDGGVESVDPSESQGCSLDVVLRCCPIGSRKRGLEYIRSRNPSWLSIEGAEIEAMTKMHQVGCDSGLSKSPKKLLNLRSRSGGASGVDAALLTLITCSLDLPRQAPPKYKRGRRRCHCAVQSILTF